jgi:hypothetical protein
MIWDSTHLLETDLKSTISNCSLSLKQLKFFLLQLFWLEIFYYNAALQFSSMTSSLKFSIMILGLYFVAQCGVEFSSTIW